MESIKLKKIGSSDFRKPCRYKSSIFISKATVQLVATNMLILLIFPRKRR